jgi:uncharacterized LabA/DUF88 family protein
LLEDSNQPVQQFAYTKGKNATDSALIIDAMDLLYAGNLDGFCLVSSDSDFTRLASRLKESGKRVYGFGELKTPKPFVAACDRFIYTEILGKTGSELPRRKSAAEMDRDAEFIALVGDAIDDSADVDGWANLSAVGSIIRNKKPDFDPRNYGYKKLSELLDASSYFEAKLINNVAMVKREKK